MDDPERVVAALLAVPLFEKLDDDGREMLAFEARLGLGSETIPDDMPQRTAYVRFVDLDADAELVREGDLTTEFTVVLSGAVQSSYLRGEFEPVPHRRYRSGDWFGEVSALSHHPALTTCTAADDAEGDTQVALLDNRLFVKLHNENDEFRQLVDGRYSEDYLALHLGHSTMLRDLDIDELHELAQQAELIRLAAGEVLTEQDAPVDAFYLVRTGALECKRVDGKTSVLAFYRGNSSFGEHSIVTESARWPGSCTAIMTSDIVKLPKSVFDELSPDAMRVATSAANRVLCDDGMDAGAEGLGSVLEDEVHVMLTRESVKGGARLFVLSRSDHPGNLHVPFPEDHDGDRSRSRDSRPHDPAKPGVLGNRLFGGLGYLGESGRGQQHYCRRDQSNQLSKLPRIHLPLFTSCSHR